MSHPSQVMSWKSGILLIGLLLYGVFPLLTSKAINLSRQQVSFQSQNQGTSSSSLDSSRSKDTYSLPPDKLSKAIRLSRIQNILHFVSALWSIAFLWLLLRTQASSALASWAAKWTGNYWLQGLIFLPLLLLLLTLSDLPLASYQHHLSLSYGLSVQRWASWFGDWSKSLLLSLIFGTLILLLFMLVVRKSPRRYWFWFWMASIPIMIFTVFAFPIFIEPLFDHFEPLAKSDPALVQQLERLVARTGTHIPPEHMFLMKASEKSTGLNAYVTGLGSSKRVVVWDTTIQKLPTDDILFIFGHESGHYVLNHIWKGIGATCIFLFFVFLAGSYLARKTISREGRAWSIESAASWAALPMFLLIVTTLSFVTEPVVNKFSRMQEHQADIYGQEAIHGIVYSPQQTAVHSFQALGEAYLDDPNPSRWIEFWTYDHPSVKTRVAFAANYDPWQAGKSPRYFKK